MSRLRLHLVHAPWISKKWLSREIAPSIERRNCRPKKHGRGEYNIRRPTMLGAGRQLLDEYEPEPVSANVHKQTSHRTVARRKTLAPTDCLVAALAALDAWRLILKGSDGRKLQLSLHEHNAEVKGSPGSYRISREEGFSVRTRGRNEIISTRAHWVLVATTLASRRLTTFQHDKGASASVWNPTDRSRSGSGGEDFLIPNARLVPHLPEGWK